MKTDRILIIRTDRIGDVALSTAAIRALRQAYPESYLAAMVRPYTRDIVEGNPYLDEVIIYDKDKVHKGVLASLKFACELRKKKFDLAVILHPANRVHLIAWLAGIPHRIGYNKKFGFLLTRAVKDTRHLGLMHEIDYTLKLLEEIGVYAKERILFMPVKEEETRWVSDFFREKEIDKAAAVFCIHPGASCVSKRWPAGNFAKLIDALIEEFNARIILFAGEQDRKTADEVYCLSRHKPIYVLEGAPLRRIAALLKESNLLISNDSGPIHISAAVGTSVIAIFGRKQAGLSPKRWGPIGKKDIVLHKDAGCQLCLAHNCRRDFQCLKMIAVEDVLDAVRKIL